MSDPPSADLAAWLRSQYDLAQLAVHDIRNPIAALLANVSYLELVMRDADSDTRDALADMKLASDAVVQLIEQMQSITRLEARPRLTEHETRPFDARESVRAAVTRIEPATRAAGIELAVDVVAADATLRGDRALFEQMVALLIGNAMQHVRRGQSARLTLARTDGAITVTLDDSGPAFASAEREFSREGQLALKSRSDTRYSRGLGLYLVGLIARAMDATISVGGEAARGHVAIRFPV